MDTDRHYGEFRANATRRWRGDDLPYGEFQCVKIDANTETREQAEALVAIFPKYVKAHYGPVSSRPEWGGDYFHVSIQVSLTADGVNGGYNETGVKRYVAARKAIEKAGLICNWAFIAKNADTEEAFIAEVLS